MPPAKSSDGSLKLLMITSGNPLKASKETVFERETLSKIVPRDVTRSFDVVIVHSKLGLCSKDVAKSVKL